MGKGTKVVAHEGMGTDTSIFFINVGMGMHCNTLPIEYPLPSLQQNENLKLFWGLMDQIRKKN